MNRQQAKEILALYRPGTADAEDPAFGEALRWCENDPELEQWFEQHCAIYLALRAKFRQITIPEGLKQQILSERKVRLTRFHRPLIASVLAAFTVAVVAIFAYSRMQPHEDTSYLGYLHRMAGTALRSYQMDLSTTNFDQIHAYVAGRKGVADYTVPEGLSKNARPTGCVLVSWQGRPVTMVCFNSGIPHARVEGSDLWLLVAEQNSVRGAPKPGSLVLKKVNRVMAAAWTDHGKTYLLLADGNEAFLRRYL